MDGFDLHHGDCFEVLRSMPDCSVDSIVTDPPYGLRLMGKKWDYDVPSVQVWQECLRVLKPGGHLLAFAGTRTQHRMAVRIEDAGFEIRDMIAWVYGSGFPKSHTLQGDWQGWGTALKPAMEPITVARKPLISTVAENVQQWGTGALNIDGCRVGIENCAHKDMSFLDVMHDANWKPKDVSNAVQGRWPANLVHDGSDEVVAGFPQAKAGGGVNGAEPSSKTDGIYGKFAGRVPFNGYSDTGSAARFFYCAKASKVDRDEGLEAQPELARGNMHQGDSGMNSAKLRKNHHPTVKPTDLMRYLCRLVTPPGGTVLDPFTGSGSTGKAAVLEGFRFVGIEREAEYVEIACRRIENAAAQGRLFEPEMRSQVQERLL